MTFTLPLLTLLSVAGPAPEEGPQEPVAVDDATRLASGLEPGGEAPEWGDSHGLSFYLESAAVYLTGVNVEYRYRWFAARANVTTIVVGRPPVLVGGSLFGLLFEGNHHLELGLSVGVFITDENIAMVAPSVGYRYQAPDGGILVRAGLYAANVPFFEERRFFPIPQASIGYAF
ncbi:MAG: hypothetical protein RMA76_21130 [Deltaproteobacteria bacterium]|jgi:hypothetical protein